MKKLLSEIEHKRKFEKKFDTLSKKKQTTFRKYLEANWLDEMVNGVMSWKILRSILKRYKKTGELNEKNIS